MQSEVTRFHIAMFANDDVKQDDARLFTFDPIGRIQEWRAAMLTNPSHTRKFSNHDAIAIRQTVPFRKGKYWKLKEPMSRLCDGQDVYENRCRYWTSVLDIQRLQENSLRRGIKTAVHQRVRYGETEQYGIELD